MEYEKSMLCKTILKRGNNKGLFCLRKNCNIKNHNNIAVYLNLPKEIVDKLEKHKNLFDYYKLVDTLEFFSNEQNILTDKYESNIMCIFNILFETKKNAIKLVLFIYIYKLLDLPLFKSIFVNTNFYEIANTKLKEFSRCKSLKYKVFIEYINKTFVSDERFFCRNNLS